MVVECRDILGPHQSVKRGTSPRLFVIFDFQFSRFGSGNRASHSRRSPASFDCVLCEQFIGQGPNEEGQNNAADNQHQYKCHDFHRRQRRSQWRRNRWLFCPSSGFGGTLYRDRRIEIQTYAASRQDHVGGDNEGDSDNDGCHLATTATSAIPFMSQSTSPGASNAHPRSTGLLHTELSK